MLGFFSFAGAAPLNPLNQIIEGAKKEGTVDVVLKSSFTVKSMERLEKEIKEKFGIALKIQYTPSGGMQKALATAIMESRVGASPSYDLMNFSYAVIEGMKEGIFDRVDWKPLLTKDTNPGVVMNHPAFRGGITYFTNTLGLIYNSQRVSEDSVPKTFRDLADPKWKGKVGISKNTDTWSRRAFILGKDKVLSDLRAILKNGTIQGQYTDLQNRYLLGEIWMAFSNSSYWKEANNKGVPTGWQSLDYADVSSTSLVVRKGAKHPNAAKLVALYLASPEGARFTLEESATGTLFYAGNYEHDISLENKKKGIREVYFERNQQLIDAYSSEDFDKCSKEVELILMTGG